MNPFQPAGILFPFPILHIDRPTRGDLLRGFFENVAFSLRGNCEQIAAVDGDAVDRLWVSGGMTRSPTLLGILAATLQAPLVVGDVAESASLGRAGLAAVGCGLYPDLASAVDGMVRTHVVEPDAARTACFDDRYRRWREIYATFRSWTL
jgi:sugar (pentulose or hexulose) kinase